MARHRVGFLLILVVRSANGQLGLQLVRLRAALLYDVGQFMCEQVLSGGGAGAVRALTEEDVAAGGKSPGAERAIEGIGFGVGVHLHAAEVRAERAANLRADRGIQRAAAAARAVDL